VITRSQRIRLGIFVLVSLGLLLGMLVAVVGSSLFTDRDTYQIRYKLSVSGLEIGAPVKYNGVRVGRVEGISIDPDRVSHSLVTISLKEGTPVKRNAKAVLSIQGITGLKFIELVGGTSDADTLSPGSNLKAGTSVVDKLTGQAETIAIKAELLINQLLELTGEGNRALVSDVLERAGSLLNSMDQIMQRNSDEIERVLQGLATASGKLAAALEEIRKAAQETREAVAGIRRSAERVLDGKRVAAVLDEAKGAIADIRKRVGDAELGKITRLMEKLVSRTSTLVDRLDMVIARSKDDFRASIRYLAETAENLRDFSRLIREDPSRLLRQQERRERVLP
jgi:phospholipid/cholesterol/gamma-HCH transport system substrate-binding protein